MKPSRIFILLSLFVFALSCTDRLADGKRDEVPIDTGERVPVTLYCAYDKEDLIELGENSLSTKSELSASNDISDIKNLWVIQFNGTSDNATIMGNPTYINEGLVLDGTSVYVDLNLIPITTKSKVFFIANTFNPDMTFPDRLGDFTKFSSPINGENDLFSYDGQDYCLMFSGSVEPTSIMTGDKIEATVRSNVAKMSVTVVNDSFEAVPQISVKGIRMSSVPASSYYFPDYGSQSSFPDVEKMKWIDYETKVWPSGKPQGSGEASHEFIFYLPVNRRGIISNSVPSMKLSKSPHYATRIVIEASYHDSVSGSDIPIEYTFCPGGNLTDDFNITNHTIYDYTISIKSKGDPSIDPGITDFGIVDYSLADIKRANCYILNPPETEGYWRTFCIPVDIVNLFWGYNNSLYENVPENTLSPDTPWEASVIWSEFAINNSKNFRFAGEEGGSTFSGTGTHPIKVQIPKGTSGNVLIGIKRSDIAGAPFLWSWHLWITDYNPDEGVKNQTIFSGKYEYPVKGGYINRLGGGVWDSGKYMENSFMMDRALGAMDKEPHTGGKDAGLLYYQFGRKDPFSIKAGYTKIRNDNSAVAGTDDDPAKAVKYSIANPNVFIYGLYANDSYYWTLGNRYAPLENHSFIWNDPYAQVGKNMKSIFDPCPPGWYVPERIQQHPQVPNGGAFEVLNDNEDYGHNFFWTNLGRTFGNCVYFPQAGEIEWFSGNYQSGGGNFWESTPMEQPAEPNKCGGNTFTFSSSTVSHFNAARNYGMQVRCVSVNEASKYN